VPPCPSNVMRVKELIPYGSCRVKRPGPFQFLLCPVDAGMAARSAGRCLAGGGVTCVSAGGAERASEPVPRLPTAHALTRLHTVSTTRRAAILSIGCPVVTHR
jgi:hypothetical protein